MIFHPFKKIGQHFGPNKNLLFLSGGEGSLCVDNEEKPENFIKRLLKPVQNFIKELLKPVKKIYKKVAKARTKLYKKAYKGNRKSSTHSENEFPFYFELNGI